ncbi:centrosomal protein [Chloropicon primus]|uniref:Centrosomal protein n=1 Tax=Chloropicon primus TaxID=1764295 RepID=A0A5B8MLZ4_9CHLO|nr:centrosomal protein [Chloropicon primus]|eukprot:QDZ20320.1 centrosomal protein [Chloropicon primus]
MPQEGLAPEPENCSMKKLGHLSFDSNERSNHQARELKSVHINTKALLLRFVLQECHMNRLNSYGQVGIVAINIKGEPMVEYNGGGVAHLQQAMHNMEMMGGQMDRAPVLQQAVPKAPTPFSLQGFDPLTASIIADVERAKTYAVEQEDYDEAKRLKAKIDYMKRIGAQIGELEAQKKIAVQEEDYDKAKSLKMEISVLRRRLEGQPTAASPLNLQTVPVGAATPGTIPAGTSAGAIAAESSPVSAEKGEAFEQAAAPQNPVNPLSPERDVSYDHLPYDERPAQAKGMMNAFIKTPERFKTSPTGAGAEEGGDAKTPMAMQPLQTDMQEMMSEAGSRPGEPSLETLSSSDEKSASLLFGLLGEEAARCIYSKHWQLREKGISQMIDILTSGGMEGDVREGFRLISHYILGKTLKDKVAHIVESSVDCLRELLTNYGSQVGGREVQHTMLELVPILIDRVGESNGIIRDRAFEAILMLSNLPEVGNGGVLAQSLVKPIKRQSQWKPILSRLNLLNELLPRFGVSQHKQDKGDYSHGFTVDAVMAFVNPAFSSANQDVRKSAIAVAKIVMDTVGEQSMERILPSDLNPYIKDAILSDMPQRHTPVVKRTPAPKAKSSTKPKAVSSNRSASKQPAKKAAAPKPKPSSAKPDKENILPQAEPEPEMEPEPEPEPLSQVELLEQEIANREAKYGHNHIEVGHALVDLAVLLSEEGRPDDSVPLYERALNVYEEAEGAESSNVAQTLTDLAVIHIEAGRDDIGKPQLERAQSILEKELGPDHEDVQAIKDVLDNLEDEPED